MYSANRVTRQEGDGGVAEDRVDASRRSPPISCRISPWTAEFIDPDTEAAYRRRNAPASIRQARYGLGLWAAFLLVFVYTDYLNLGWTGFFLLFYLLPEDQTPWVIAMTMALLIGQFVFIPSLVTTGTIPAVYGVLGTLFSVCQVSEVSAEELGALAMMLVAPGATILFVVHRFQSSQRKAFARLLQAEQANTELQKEIQMRRELEARLKEQVAF